MNIVDLKKEDKQIKFVYKLINTIKTVFINQIQNIVTN